MPHSSSDEIKLQNSSEINQNTFNSQRQSHKSFKMRQILNIKNH